MTMIRYGLLMLLAALPLFQAAQAHTGLASSAPADGEVLEQAPDALALDFSDEVELVEATLKGPDGRPVETGYQPPVEPAASFSVPLPALEPGQYTLEWTAVGEEDGHTILGDVSFTVADAG